MTFYGYTKVSNWHHQLAWVEPFLTLADMTENVHSKSSQLSYGLLESI